MLKKRKDNNIVSKRSHFYLNKTRKRTLYLRFLSLLELSPYLFGRNLKAVDKSDSFPREGAGRGLTKLPPLRITPPCHFSANRPPPQGGNLAAILFFRTPVEI